MTYEEQRGPTRERPTSPLPPASTPVPPTASPSPPPPIRLTGRYAC
jgi:hypothetical protein